MTIHMKHLITKFLKYLLYTIKIIGFFSPPLSVRLANFSVIVSNVSLMVTADQLVQSTGFISCGQFSGYPAAGATGRVTCRPGPIRGRFVHITLPRTQTLTLCEVMIMSTEGTHLYNRPSVNS